VLNSDRRRPLLVIAAVLAAVPGVFGLVRAVSTGDDFRYLWLAAAAMIGSTVAVRVFGYRAPGAARVTPGRVVAAVATGAGCAAATAIFMGATAGPGVAIVAVAFGLCTGVSAVLTSLARWRRTP
jgi:hypothetical protein